MDTSSLSAPLPLSLLPPNLVHQLLQALNHYFIVHYATAAGFAFYLYDWILTFDDEVRFFWGTHSSPAKILFFANRYFALLSIIGQVSISFVPPTNIQTCVLSMLWGSIVGVLIHGIVEVILLLRVSALYNQQRTVTLVLGAALAVDLIAMIIIEVIQSVQQISFSYKTDMPIVPVIHLCNGNISSFLYALWIPGMCIDFGLLLAVAYAAVQRYRRQGIANSTPIFRLLVRDSFLYFFSVFLVYLANLILWKAAPYDLLQLGILYGFVVPSAAANRLLISLRQAGSQHAEDSNGMELSATRSSRNELKFRVRGTENASGTYASSSDSTIL